MDKSKTDDTGQSSEPGYEQALQDLAQILAHRIRGLVASIEGYTDLLTDTLVTREQRELALRIFEGASRIEKVLSDLQRYAKPLEPVMLPLRISDVMDDLLIHIEEVDRNRVIIVVPEENQRFMTADPILLRQALLVLLQNALDATRHGGTVTINVSFQDEDNQILFAVKNDGFIALADPEQVFLPFNSTKAQNLGVGLPIAARITQMHGGSLQLTTNSEKEGICFSISMPVAEE